MEGKNESRYAATSMLHDSLEARAFETFPGGVCGFLIAVRTNLHTVILVALRRNHEGRKFFLLQVRCEAHRVRLPAERRNLQSVRTRRNARDNHRLARFA